MARPHKPEGTTADKVIGLRMTPTDRDLLAALVADQHARNGFVGTVTTADIVRHLVHTAARERGLVGGAEDASTTRSRARRMPLTADPSPQLALRVTPELAPVVPAAKRPLTPPMVSGPYKTDEQNAALSALLAYYRKPGKESEPVSVLAVKIGMISTNLSAFRRGKKSLPVARLPVLDALLKRSENKPL